MACIRRYKNSDRSTSFVAQVRITPFRPIARSFATRLAAQAWADETERSLKAQRDRGADRSDLSHLTLKTLIDEFRADPEVKTRKYFPDLELLLAWWGNAHGTDRVADLGVLKLRAVRDRLKGDGKTARAAGTVNRYLSAMRACWNWGRASGLIAQERGWPTHLMLTEPRGRTRYLGDDELLRLLATAKKHSALMHAAILLSLATGMRQGELFRLKWSDIDFSRARIRILQTKNGESRAVHLPPVASEALKALLRGHAAGAHSVFMHPKGVPFDKGRLAQPWNLIRSAAGLSDFRWHDLRHSCASFLAQRGASLLEIGSVLGHRSPSVTMRYSHLVQGAPVTGHAALDEKLRPRQP
jgi:integrase